MLSFARPVRDEGGVVHQIAVIIGVSLLSGVLIAGMALPWVGLASKGAEESAAAMESFPLRLKFRALPERTRVLAADGTKLAVLFDENRKYVHLDEISAPMQEAMVAIEDARFYTHGPIDVQGTLRALVVNQTSGGVVQGGSTITQQLVKLTLQENADTDEARAAASDDTYARKVAELRYATWVEDNLSKRVILEKYLNAAYFGDGAYGIEAAARHYFSTSAAKLTTAQSALLAGVVKNPTSYNPTNNQRSALKRRNTVVATLLDLGKLTEGQAKRISASSLGLKVTDVSNGCVESAAPFFCDYLIQYLLKSPDLGDSEVERRALINGGGLTIKSTIDLRFQKAADESVGDHVFATDRAIGGLAMVEPGTGYVKAIAQSRPMGRKQKKGETFLNYVVHQKYGDSRGFQPGSTFKAFVLAEAIKQGVPLDTEIYSPSVIQVPHSDFPVCNGEYLESTEAYRVHNSTDSGTFDLYTGTQKSVNTFYVQLEKITGLCGPIRLTQEMGVEIEDPERFMTPSFTLGTVDVSPLEMAEAYATFGARGVHCASLPVLEIRDRNGDVFPTTGSRCERLFPRPVADAVNDILLGVIEPGGFAYLQQLKQDAAGKTGTVQDTKGVWFLGYTPNLATASMIAGANAQGSPLDLRGLTIGGELLEDASGSGTAAPMWGDAMKAIQQWLPNKKFVEPDPEVVEGKTKPFPSFFGYSTAAASAKLKKLGFEAKVTSTVYSAAPVGTVVYTSPSGEAAVGQTILLYVSQGPPPTPTATPTPSPTPTPTATPTPSPTPTPTAT
ncbi:MAG: transglycosylase domain-containing protein, partial [Nocardioidaceae bacterium]|nr:transglycosylase domain-containing protein [Nocardioidaceae bacterium]